MDGAGLKGGEIGVLMSRGELLALIRGRVRDPSEGAGRDQRMRALIGRLADPRPIPADELGEALAYLPGWVAGSPEIRKAGDLLETYARAECGLEGGRGVVGHLVCCGSPGCVALTGCVACGSRGGHAGFAAPMGMEGNSVESGEFADSGASFGGARDCAWR